MSSDKVVFSSMQGLDDGDQSENKVGGLTPQVSESKVGGLTPQASNKKDGGLTPQASNKKDGGLTPQVSESKAGEMTPQVTSNKVGGLTPLAEPLEPNYSPATPLKDQCAAKIEKESKSPDVEYSSCSDVESCAGEADKKILDFSDAGLDYKHDKVEAENPKEKEPKSKKEKRKAKSAEENKSAVASAEGISESNLEEILLGDEDKATAETLRIKSGAHAGFVVKKYKMIEQRPAHCTVCPRNTNTVFALFKRGELVTTTFCDTAFCLLAMCNTYFLTEEDQQETVRWIESKIKKKIEKASAQGSREAAIHMCNTMVESVEAFQSVKKDLRKCLERGPDSGTGEFIQLLKDAKVLELHEKKESFSGEKFKELSDVGIKKADLKCACGKDTNIAVTIVGIDTLIGGRVNIHCENLNCLVRSLEQNANMTPSANPKAVEISAAGRENIDEDKAKKLHRLIFLGRELVKINVVSTAWKETEGKRVHLSKAFIDKKETDENLENDSEKLKQEKLLDGSRVEAKVGTRRIVEEIKKSREEIASKIQELNESIAEDATLLEGQEGISQINKEIQDIENKINELTLQVNSKKAQKGEEIKKHAVAGVRNFRVLLEANPFEKIANLTKMLFEHDAKMKIFRERKLQMEQMSERLVHFYENILGVPEQDRLKEQQFVDVLDIESGYEEPNMTQLRKVVERCGLMQVQAREIEKQAWVQAYNEGNALREKHHRSIVDRMSSAQEKYKALLERNTVLKDEITFLKVGNFEEKRDQDAKIARLEADLAAAVEKAAHAEKEMDSTRKALKEFEIKLEKFSGNKEGKKQQEEEQWSEVVRRNPRGAGSGEGRGGGRGGSVSSHGQRGQPHPEQQSRRNQVEREERDRDGRQEAREDDRDREEQERYQSQVQPRRPGPPMPGPYPIPQQRGPEQGSFRSFEHNQPGFSDHRPFPPPMSGDQFAIAYRDYLAHHQSMFANFQDHGLRSSQNQEDGSQNRRVCTGWINGSCRFGENCKYQHGWQESQAKRARRD